MPSRYEQLRLSSLPRAGALTDNPTYRPLGFPRTSACAIRTVRNPARYLIQYRIWNRTAVSTRDLVHASSPALSDLGYPS